MHNLNGNSTSTDRQKLKVCKQV